MLTGITTSGVIWLIILGLFMVLAFPITVSLVGFWLVRAIKKNKKTQLQEWSGKEEVRCLGCGAVIDSKQQSCQTCGWTWK